MLDKTSFPFGRRFSYAVALFAVLICEKLTLLHLPPDWMLGAVRNLGGAPAALALALLFFGFRRLRGASLPLRFSLPIFALHLGSIAALIGTQVWYRRAADLSQPGTLSLSTIAGLWTALIIAAAFSLLWVAVPLRSFAALIRSLGIAWIYAVVVTGVITLLRQVGVYAWAGSSSNVVRFIQRTCFRQTQAVLQHFYPTVVSDPATSLLGTPRFQVEVSWLCSGIEGMILVAVLIALWIVFYRRELVLTRALLIAPIALSLAWTANILRLAALISIGDHGHPHMASVGFHAQAGWITLNLITLGCLFLVQNHAWFRKDGVGRSTRRSQEKHVNYPALYLLPFTAIIACSLITQGLAEGLESLYFVRPIVALAALWLLRREYKKLDWHCGATAVLCGAFVAGVWLAVSLRFQTPSAEAVLASAQLRYLDRAHRWFWIASRVFAATVTVPIAEELAFRGYVARRVMRREFQEQPYRSMNWISLVVSSAAFGVLHGRMWIAGTLTGALFWWLARSRNRIGDAVVAHAVANGLIAIVAVHLHNYSLW